MPLPRMLFCCCLSGASLQLTTFTGLPPTNTPWESSRCRPWPAPDGTSVNSQRRSLQTFTSSLPPTYTVLKQMAVRLVYTCIMWGQKYECTNWRKQENETMLWVLNQIAFRNLYLGLREREEAKRVTYFFFLSFWKFQFCLDIKSLYHLPPANLI